MYHLQKKYTARVFLTVINRVIVRFKFKMGKVVARLNPSSFQLEIYPVSCYTPSYSLYKVSHVGRKREKEKERERTRENERERERERESKKKA